MKNKSKKKSIVARLILWAVILGALAALVIFVGIPLFAEDDTFTGELPEIAYYEGGKTPLVMENDALRFELDPTNTHFKLTEKATGREWLSNPADSASDPIALSANKDLLDATLTVTYSTSSGTIDLDNNKYSIQNGVYTVEQQEDGSIRVDYTVGKVEKVYVMPTAITVERFTAFMDAMGSSNSKKAKTYYVLYDPEKLDTKSNKDEIIANYPEVLNQPLYILKSDTSETNKKKIQGYFEKGGYTYEDYELDSQLVAGSSSTVSAVFNVSVVYRLDGSDFVVEVPYEAIRYNPDYPIIQVTVLPMFGAAGTQDEGYMLVPEGGGALINFNNGKLTQSSYYANMYGWDYGTERTEAVSETRSDFPVFGMAKNGGSFICIIESGASNAIVQADISGRYNSYNWVCARYKVLHRDQYNISAKTAQLVYMYEKQIPDTTLVQRYRFIDSDSYVDMALSYADYLEARYPDLNAGSVSEDVPVVVELVGAIDKTVQRFGLPIDTVVETTTFSEAETILDDLLARGVKNLNLRMSGWCNGGITQRVLTSVHVESGLGGKKGMSSLIAKAKAAGVPLYFDGVTCFAYDSTILNGFLTFSDAARFTTREQIKIYPYDVVDYLPAEWMDPYYLVRPQYAQKNASTLISALSDAGAAGVAFRDIGFLLSGNYNPKDTVPREQVLQMNLDTMAEARDAGLNVMIKSGNDYAMPYADIITDMDVDGIKYAILDKQVPFYQIAIHGMKEYATVPLNLADDNATELLRCAEYGTGLNFTFFAESAMIVQDTYHTGYYGAEYADWVDKAVAFITRYQSDMAGLNCQRIVGHDYLASEVTVTRYANGTNVYVNYSDTEFTAEGVTIPARDWCVKGGEAQ